VARGSEGSRSTLHLTWCIGPTQAQLFDAATPTWQSRCSGSMYGCYRRSPLPRTAESPPTFAELPGRGGPGYLYQSDRWNNGAADEGLVQQYWEPLQLGADGSIAPLRCGAAHGLPLAGMKVAPDPVVSQGAETTGDAGFRAYSDVAGTISRAWTFTVHETSTLSRVWFTAMQSGHLEAGLDLRLVRVESDESLGQQIGSGSVASAAICWSRPGKGCGPKAWLDVMAGAWTCERPARG
jgi:hypothetical protein